MPEVGPFRSLSDLSEGSNSPVFKKLLSRHSQDPGYRRRFGTDYIEKRRAIEAELRSLFIQRGGQPIRLAPYYLTLGESPWFRNLNSSHKEIRIALKSLDPRTTSLTFPDSFIALTKPEKAYYRKVYMLHEIDSLWSTYSLPRDDSHLPHEDYWKTDFEFYAEIQVWSEIKDTEWQYI